MSGFAHTLTLADLDRGPVTLRLTASPEDFPSIAERLGTPAIHALKAELKVYRKSGRVLVQGAFHATVEQICVISLDPFNTAIEGEIDEEFLQTDEPDSLEVDLDPDGIEAEPLAGDTLDIADLVIQNISLALDPHPRADGADLSNLEYDERQLGTPASPFAALAKLQGQE